MLPVSQPLSARLPRRNVPGRVLSDTHVALPDSCAVCVRPCLLPGKSFPPPRYYVISARSIVIWAAANRLAYPLLRLNALNVAAGTDMLSTTRIIAAFFLPYQIALLFQEAAYMGKGCEAIKHELYGQCGQQNTQDTRKYQNACSSNTLNNPYAAAHYQPGDQ
jgi:hypothetical protein